MSDQMAQQFGNYLRHLRMKQGLSNRELARLSGVDSGGITRLERGENQPTPKTLLALAPVLKVSPMDLFAMAGYTVPYDLPDLPTYLRTMYGSCLPENKIDEIGEYLGRILDEYGADLDGPRDAEDETTGAQPT